MKNPALINPDALQALYALSAAVKKGRVPEHTLHLVHLRTSQINGCGLCVDLGSREMKKSGESDERLFATAAWRDTPFFTDAERAALALAESVTRLSDSSDPVPDAIWEEAARHFDEAQLSTLLLHIAQSNMWNRLNVSTRQLAGSVKLD